MKRQLKNKFFALTSIISNRIPGQLVIQMTDWCNARCPQCGMRVTKKFSRSTLDTDYLQRLIDAAAEKNFQAVSFTGGEPFLYTDQLIELIQYAGSAGIPYIRTGTNGFMFRDPEHPRFKIQVYRFAEKLADTPLRNFWISIDSAFDQVHEQMRGFAGIMKGIEKALPIFHETGLFPSVNLGINRNINGAFTNAVFRKNYQSEKAYLSAFYGAFCEGLDQFYRRVIDMGFTMANTCYPMSIGVEEQAMDLSPVYAATNVESVVNFDASEKSMLFKALMEIIPKWRDKIRIFTPLYALAVLDGQYDKKENTKLNGCRGGIDFFFVDAGNGDTYPCGYRGNENMGKLWEMNLSDLKKRIVSENCNRCDWECFRDPTEFIGPVLQVFSSPWSFLNRIFKRDRLLSLWLRDMFYYRACDFFDGRKPPDYERMKPHTNLINY